jgi:uncharacterized repeat protein (TIGR01451 family)
MNTMHSLAAVVRAWRGRTAAAAILAAGALCFGAVAHAQTPPAGSTIGNQASATYLDASLTPRTVTSNLVTTVVQQVASLTLTADGSITAAPGGQAAFPHVLTNTGNGSDNFSLALVNLGGDDFDLTGLSIYADADGNGVPDNAIPLASTGPLAAGAPFRFVVVGNVPGVQVGGQLARARVTGTSTFDAGQSAFNTDLVTVTGNAVISVTKAISQNSGPSPYGPLTYTMTYTNSGNSAATNLVLTDVIPAGMTYVAGSGRWSTTGATVLTDANLADAQGIAPNTVIYDFGVTALGTVTARINQVAPGASGTLTFQINVNAGLAPQTIDNSASYAYFDGAANVGPFTTNLAAFTVVQSASLTFSGQTIASALQGATVLFSNTLTNTGNGTDVFDISLNGSTFPGGTSFSLYQSDGVTPLTDTNGNGTPDTGPLGAGAAYVVVMQATLPPAATGGPFTVNKLARSWSDPLQTATAIDQLTTITVSSVDVTNNSPGGPGAGSGPELVAVITNATNPGTTTRFTLYVENTSLLADGYDLSASTDPSFVTTTLPAGWTVTFRDGALSVITSTGSIGGGANRLVYADVSVPAGYGAGAVSVYFRARSPVSGALDRIHDAVDVNAVRALTMVPNNSASIAPGGSVTYTHLLINNGNVSEGDAGGSVVTLATSDNQPAWTSTLYWDTNNSGVYDAGDNAISDLAVLGGLAPGGSVRLFVRVFAPAGAPLGTVDLTVVTATATNVLYTSPAPPAATADDNTTVIDGQLQIVKTQGLDADCDGFPEFPFDVLPITTGANPGVCLRYEITVTNVGTAAVTNLVVSDATPANTVYSGTIAASTSVGTISTPPSGSAGTISATIGTLGPGQTAVINFGIRINP